jgi:uncharacterized protein (DUF433 family)
LSGFWCADWLALQGSSAGPKEKLWHQSPDLCYFNTMTASFDSIRDAVLHLPKGDQVRLLALVALGVADAYPGIDFNDRVCGGAARIVRTRIPVWLLESLRRGGKTDAELLAAYPGLTAEDLANAWHYARSHREEMDREIADNGDES